MSDLISRQNAIDALQCEWCVEKINNLQSAEPKTGAWIRCKKQRKKDLDNGNALYECSNCGHTDLHAETQEVPYCWFCGADMGGKKSDD